MNQKDITEGLEQMEAGAINPKQAAQKTAAGSKVAAQAMGAKGSSGAMMQKGLDKLASGGAMSGQLSQQIAPFAKQLSTILGDQALRQKFMMLVKQAKKTAPAAAPAPAPAAPQAPAAAPAGVAPAKENTNEGLAELAGVAERDHEVQMARADLYKIAKYAIKLHDMLKSTSEAEGIEGWQQSKITKAADYMGSVFHAMDYDSKFEDMPVDEGKSPHKKGTKKYKKHMAAMHAEGADYKQHIANKLSEAMASLEETANTCPECGNAKANEGDEYVAEKQRLDPKCWKGKKIGSPKTKMKGGVRVNNCVPA
jgi:hypothetical protein